MTVSPSAPKPLTAICDLSLCNPNFEFFNFLILAELERETQKLDYIHLVFVPGDEARFYQNTTHPDDENWWRFQNILLQGASLLPSCKQISTLECRADAQAYLDAAHAVYPSAYRLDKPVAGYCINDLAKYWLFGRSIPSLAAPDYAVSRVQKWIELNAGGRLPITITLRQDADNAARNNQPSEWLIFLRGLDRDKYFPIVIPDTGAIFRDTTAKFFEFEVYPEFSLHILMRAALYETAYLNFFSANGPAIMCSLNRATRFIALNIAVWEDAIAGSGAFETAFGVPIGDQLPFCSWHQRFVFEPDTAAIIQREFDNFIEAADGRLSIEEYRPAKVHAPEDVGLRFRRGRSFVQARDIYERLLEADPSRIDVQLALANTYLDVNDYPAAFALAYRLADAMPDHVEINLLLAELFLATGKWDDAYRSWSKLEKVIGATDANPEGMFVRFIWAMERMGKISELTGWFQENIRKVGESHLIYRAMGEVYAKRSLSDIARSFFVTELMLLEKKIELGAADVQLDIRCAELHGDVGRPERAIEILDPLLSSNNFPHEILSVYAMALEKRGRARDAIEFHRKAIQLSGRINGKIILRLAELHYRLGELDEAILWAAHCNKIAPDEAQVLRLLSEVLFAAGQTAEALRYSVQLQRLMNAVTPLS